MLWQESKIDGFLNMAAKPDQLWRIVFTLEGGRMRNVWMIES